MLAPPAPGRRLTPFLCRPRSPPAAAVSNDTQDTLAAVMADDEFCDVYLEGNRAALRGAFERLR